jgi:NAD(P)-dependent dehydrogenase (short-subunit alcohol dehydrogenase family)
MTFGSFGDPDDPVARDRRRYRQQLAPLRRIATPQDIAEAVWFLASAGARQVTGAELIVDGGTDLTTMPGSHPAS